MARLVSFDIDGTLEVGDPPGVITMEMVRRAKALGWLIGSCSDRPVIGQRRIWEQHEIAVDFAVPKPGLPVVRSQFKAESYLHIGDTDIDRQFARRAGFDFLHVTDAELDAFLQHLAAGRQAP